jgi:hypothetical protein
MVNDPAPTVCSLQSLTGRLTAIITAGMYYVCVQAPMMCYKKSPGAEASQEQSQIIYYGIIVANRLIRQMPWPTAMQSTNDIMRHCQSFVKTRIG